MPFDWLHSSQDHRRQLYRSCKRVVDGHYVGDWSKFLSAVFDDKFTSGAGFLDNFRNGRIGRPKAAAFARWLSVHHTQEAVQLAERIAAMDDSWASAWDDLCAARAQRGRLAIMPLSDLAIVGFADASADRTMRLRLSEEFCLRFDSPHAGHVIAMQCVRATWHPLPLSLTSLPVAVAKGLATLPRDERDGAVIPLADHEDGGRVRFILILSPRPFAREVTDMLHGDGPFDQSTLDTMARSIAASDGVSLHEVELLII
jgi:hypothetical protein